MMLLNFLASLYRTLTLGRSVASTSQNSIVGRQGESRFIWAERSSGLEQRRG